VGDRFFIDRHTPKGLWTSEMELFVGGVGVVCVTVRCVVGVGMCGRLSILQVLLQTAAALFDMNLEPISNFVDFDLELALCLDAFL